MRRLFFTFCQFFLIDFAIWIVKVDRSSLVYSWRRRNETKTDNLNILPSFSDILMTDRYDWIFRTYDIRSLDHDPMDEMFCYSFGRGIAKYMKSNGRSNQAVMISCDGRPSNTNFMIAFVAWLEDAWHDLYETCNKFAGSVEWQEHIFGVCCSSFFYYCAAENFNVSVQFTASHNPPERVGCKWCDSTASLYPSLGFKAMVEEYIEYPYLDTERHETIRNDIIRKVQDWSDRMKKKEESYIQIVVTAFKKISKPLTIVVDYSGWAAVSREKYFLEVAIVESGAPITIIQLNEKIDGTFSCHLSDTSIPDNYKQVGAEVVKHQADFGVMFDGDADRIGMVDQYGKYIQWWNLVALIACGVLAVKWWGNIVWDITCTNAVQEWVEELWWSYHVSRVWYRFVKQTMKEHNAVFGGELSCHFLFPETAYSESPLLALAYVMKTLELYDSITDTIEQVNPYITPPLRNYTVEDKDGVLACIKSKYSSYEINELDGVKVIWPDRWLVVRKSGTEPIIRFFVEAKNQEKIDEITKQIEEIINSFV